ncbi:MAG: putative ABC exporter domain-containing protein [Defluviitaleaceae bacterium]|nr:putative ABC exporter domain-containing protein [Defluviitaleaceae bacterium]
MRSLFYLTRATWKNRLAGIFKSPGKLIMYLVIIAGIVGLIVMTLSGGGTPAEPDEITDLVWFRGIMFAFLLLGFLPAIFRGLKQGTMLFQMSDVNLLFVSPIRPQSILLYAVIRTIGAALLGSIFIFFQGGLARTFGFAFGGLLVVFAGYVLVTIFIQIMTMSIYMFANGNEPRKRIIKIIALALFAPLLVVAGRAFLYTGGDIMATLEIIVYSPVMAWTPILGWVSNGTIAFLGGDILGGVLFYGAILAAGALLLIYAYVGGGEYYEDAMAVTETTYEKIRAVEEGQINAVFVTDKKTKVARTGLGGTGAKAMFYRHLREASRQNRTGLWGGFSLMLVAGAAGFAFLNRDGSIATILFIFMGLNIFRIEMSRGMKDLYSHYIFLIPESPLRKMIWSNMEVVFKITVETALAFILAGIIMGTSPLLILLAILAHVLFFLVLLGCQYLFLRWVGSHVNMLMQMTIYIAIIAIVLAPGAAAALFAGFWIGNSAGLLIGLIIFALWEFIAAIGCFALSKGVLHNCDMLIMDTRLTK